VRFSSIRILLAIAAVLNLILWQFDIKGPYLHAEMDMPVYMHQFQGHERFGPNGEKMVCKLLRALYGSKQAGRLWRKKLATWLVGYGFMQCTYDECCYVWRRNNHLCILSVFVDDLILATDDMSMLDDFTAASKQVFNVDDRGALKWALGMLITRDRKRHTITLSCEARIKAMVERYAAGGVHNKTHTPHQLTAVSWSSRPSLSTAAPSKRLGRTPASRKLAR
jgi:hypothetical protein